MSKAKIVRFKGCSNIQVAKALSDLAAGLIELSKNDKKLLNLVISLAVEGWNLSLYEDSNENYKRKIEEKLPKGLSKEKKLIFQNFLLNLIKQKQETYPGYLKGITSFNLKEENGNLNLIVNALPINPL